MAALAPPPASAITALLGPTNTGKTHRAIERMLEHDTGVIGLPLRLLAREVFDRVVARAGADQVALVTGEEKLVPRRPAYWVCTVEAMPTSVEADFVAVDEIQLVEHRQRGHVFTERLLRARGRLETWFLGADTMVSLLRELLPTARITRNPRLSNLSYRGASSLGGLPPRSAVVAFSVPRVYELADAIRIRRGGAAVVLGALSPRARNAQVALFESGEVDYLVATDAIGMGLNLDVDHVALAGLDKFDGFESRELSVAELGQIAGRAGRYVRDGTFGTLSQIGELPPPLARALEEHRFEDVRLALWRNPDPDFSSVTALVGSLRDAPPSRRLRLVRDADDLDALVRLSQKDTIRRVATSTERVHLLWETCQVPDFLKLLPDAHAELVLEVYTELVARGRLGDDWMARRVERADDVAGDIATLTARLAAIRTWTYVSSHARWVDDADAWRERTHAIEDRLSDALHRALVQRFVDREARRAMRSRKRARGAPKSEEPGDVDPHSPFAALGPLARRLRARVEPVAPRVSLADGIASADEAAFEVTTDGIITYRGTQVARLRAGKLVRRPEIVVTAEGLETEPARRLVAARLRDWARGIVRNATHDLEDALLEQLSAAARGVLYQLEGGLGTVLARDAADQLRALDARDRAALEQAGIVLGRRVVYSRPSLRPKMVARRIALCQAYLGDRVHLAAPGARAMSFRPWKDVASEIHVAIGYPVFGDRAIRADAVERATAVLEQAARGGVFRPPGRLYGALGCDAEGAVPIVEQLGYRYVGEGRFVGRTSRRRRSGRTAGHRRR